MSDVSGVLFGGTVERILSPWVKPANLTAAQKRLAIVPRIRLAGAVMGVVVGCCLGASALLFSTPTPDNTLLEEDQLRWIGGAIHDMMARNLLKNTSCTIHTSTISETFREGNIAFSGAYNALANHCKDQAETFIEGSTLYVPVLSGENDVSAVLELTRGYSFAHEDVEEAKLMARNVGILMDHAVRL